MESLCTCVQSHLHTVTVVKAADWCSWLMLWSLISVPSVDGAVFCIHGWLIMSSKDGRSAGRMAKHHLISCWHSVNERMRDYGTAIKLSNPWKTDVMWPACLTCGDSPPEQNLATYNLFVLLERDVPADHVVQQNAQRPHSGRSTVVAMKFNPLRWAVNTSTYKKYWRKINKCFFLSQNRGKSYVYTCIYTHI